MGFIIEIIGHQLALNLSEDSMLNLSLHKTSIALVMCSVLPLLSWAGDSEKFASGYALAIQKGCFECHALGRTEVGPSFRAIASSYRFDPNARERLPYVIRGGSAGHWGERFAMWPQQRLTKEEVSELVDWVLSQ
jgi:cytochrome c